MANQRAEIVMSHAEQVTEHLETAVELILK